MAQRLLVPVFALSVFLAALPPAAQAGRPRIVPAPGATTPPAAPEPGAAIAFAVGIGVVAWAVRRSRR